MVAAALAMFLALALSFGVLEAALPGDLRGTWPDAVGALACALGYWAYVRCIERRAVTELNGSDALVESARGIGLGVLLALLSLLPLWGLGTYRVESVGESVPLLQHLPDMLLVAVMEELLMRAVIFRIAEQAWGSRWALLLSTLLFVAAHLPGAISVTGMLVTAAASLALSACYQLSRRLWMPIGLHFSWNYLFTAVFSVPVSGHEAKGWLHGSMSGPDWLSGGAYGIEASMPALLVWTAAALLLLRKAHARGEFRARPPRST